MLASFQSFLGESMLILFLAGMGFIQLLRRVNPEIKSAVKGAAVHQTVGFIGRLLK